jgi:hypothetical protein
LAASVLCIGNCIHPYSGSKKFSFFDREKDKSKHHNIATSKSANVNTPLRQLSPYKKGLSDMKIFLRCRQFLTIGLLFIAISSQAAALVPGEYRIVSGRNGGVDVGTFTGWRLFHSTCHGCHGALGTDVAPNLLERVGLLTPRAFVTKVLTSYRIVLPDTDTNAIDSAHSREAMIDDVLRQDRQGLVKVVMPAWEGDPTVNPHVLDLFAYLSARADGKLGIGKPELIVNKKLPKNNRYAKSKINKK